MRHSLYIVLCIACFAGLASYRDVHVADAKWRTGRGAAKHWWKPARRAIKGWLPKSFHGIPAFVRGRSRRALVRLRRLRVFAGSRKGDRPFIAPANKRAVRAFWGEYRQKLPPGHRYKNQPVPDAWSFGDRPSLADKLGLQVVRGEKTATSSRYVQDEVPELGPAILLDGAGDPIAVIEITEVTVRRYDEVDAQFAYEEGGPVRTLESWRAAHEAYFTQEGQREGYRFEPSMLLTCERMRVLYRRP